MGPDIDFGWIESVKQAAVDESYLLYPSFKLKDHGISKGEKHLYNLINFIRKSRWGDVVRQGGLERILQRSWFFGQQVVQVGG